MFNNRLVIVSISGIICFILNMVGAMFVFFSKNINKGIVNRVNFFSIGIMLSASIMSLIVPGIRYSTNHITSCFIFISCFIILNIFNRMVVRGSSYYRVIIVFLGFFLHNIPEGLALGSGFSTKSIMTGISLSIGIGIQNIPEGLAVASDIYCVYNSATVAFIFGVLSGILEPIFAIAGYLVARSIDSFLSYILIIAGCIMFYASINEFIYNINNEKTNIIILYSLLGFIFMMLFEFIF